MEQAIPDRGYCQRMGDSLYDYEMEERVSECRRRMRGEII